MLRKQEPIILVEFFWIENHVVSYTPPSCRSHFKQLQAISSRFQVILMGLRFLHLGEFLENEDPRQFHW